MAPFFVGTQELVEFDRSKRKSLGELIALLGFAADQR